MRRMMVFPFLILFLSASVRAGNNNADRTDTVYVMSPVIITATQAVDRLTPATFSNLTRKEIAHRYSFQDVPVLLSDLPSVTFYSENGNGLGYNYINLRGFDQRRLSVMVNGVPQNDPEDHEVYWIDFPDLLANAGTVQVQRGAGSEFYGPPAIGGSVNLVTNPFTEKPGVKLESDFGFQEFGSTGTIPLSTRKFSAAVNSGLIGREYMVYGKLAKITSSGYRDRGWINLNSYFLGAIRFDEGMTTHLHIYGGPFTDGLIFTGLPKFANTDLALRRLNLSDGWEVDSTGKGFGYAAERRPQESESFSQPHYELMNEWKISPSLTLSNTLFYISGDGYYDYDASWADTSMLRLGTAYGIPDAVNPSNTLVRAFVGNKQFGWLPRVDFDHGGGTLTVGGEFRLHRSDHWGGIVFGADLPAALDPGYHFYEYNGGKDIISGYAHELLRVEENVTLMADLQVVSNTYRIQNEKFLHNNFSYSYFFANPRLGLNYNMTEAWNAYASVSLTSREPTLRNLYAAEDAYWDPTATPQFEADTTGGVVRYNFSKPLVKPEQLWDVEWGTGYRAPAVRLNANLYWMEFTNELVKSGKVDIFGQPVTGNAQRSRHIGVELDGAVAPIEDFTVSGNVTVSRNRLVQYRIYDDNGHAVSLDGNPIAGFPDVLGNIRLTYTLGGATISVAAKYVGSFYTDNFRNTANTNDAFTVLNADLLYHLPLIKGTDVTLRGEVRNLTDVLYTMSGEGNSFFPAAERNYIVGATVGL